MSYNGTTYVCDYQGCGADLGTRGLIPQDMYVLLGADPTDENSRKDYNFCHTHGRVIVTELTATPSA